MPEPRSSFWPTTRSAIRRGDPGWAEVGDYREPLLALLAARHPRIDPAEREDLAHEILVDLRGGLASRYDADRGRFRAFLCGVVRNKLLARWKRARKRRPLEAAAEPAALSDDDGSALALAADVEAALRRWNDRVAGSGDLRAVHVVAGCLVRGESYRDIAAREGLSTDAVKRVIARAREEILADLLERTLPLAPDARRGLDWRGLAARAREVLREPRRRARTLGLLSAPVADALEGWLEEAARVG